MSSITSRVLDTDTSPICSHVSIFPLSARRSLDCHCYLEKSHDMKPFNPSVVLNTPCIHHHGCDSSRADAFPTRRRSSLEPIASTIKQQCIRDDHYKERTSCSCGSSCIAERAITAITIPHESAAAGSGPFAGLAWHLGGYFYSDGIGNGSCAGAEEEGWMCGMGFVPLVRDL